VRLLLRLVFFFLCGHIQPLVYARGNGFDFGAKLLLNLVQVKAVIVRDEIDGQAQMTKATGTPNAVKIGFRVLWKVKIDDHIHSLYVNAPSKQVYTHKVSASSVSEVMENTIPV